jgi:hypothetical protein
VRTRRATKRSGASCTQTTVSLARLRTTATAGTATPAWRARVAASTLRVWPTATGGPSCPAPLPASMRNSTGSACSRRLRPAPTKISVSVPPGTAALADSKPAACAASKASASTASRRGSTISNKVSFASTTWPTPTCAAATTPATGAVSAMRPTSAASSAARRARRPSRSSLACSTSFFGTLPSSCSRRARRRSRIASCAASSARAAWRSARPPASSVGTSQASVSPRATRWPITAMPRPAGFDAPGLGGLHPAAGIGIGHHAPGQLDHAGELAFRRRRRAHGERALHRLGHEERAVGQALRRFPRAVKPCRSRRWGHGDGRLLVRIAVVVAFVGGDRGRQQGQQCELGGMSHLTSSGGG